MNVKQDTINALRFLSVDAIQNANSGHPGLPLGAAPIVYSLFQNTYKFYNKDTSWDDRDRFILSAGHGSSLQYAALCLYGFGLKEEDMQNFRKLGSKTPGHPEYRHTRGVETSTGPLGQGIANAVGMAAAEKHLAAKFNREGFPIVNHFTYALVGDGCLEEGISYEACSFAGAHGLGKLIVLYDNNDITIEGKTNITFSEDIAGRFKAQNWQVITVDLQKNPDNVLMITNAIRKAQKETEKPSLIIFKTRIGYGSPLEDNQKCHGSPLGAENVQKTREKLGWSYPPFVVPEEVKKHTSSAARRGAKAFRAWKKLFEEYKEAYPELAKEYLREMKGEKIDTAPLENMTFSKPVSTRQASSDILQQAAHMLPYLMGGSADLGPSNLTIMKDTREDTFGDFSKETPEGRNIHFGIREHAMAAIANGMQLHGGIRAYCATFFVFSDYCKNAVRLSALMNIPVLYLFTHDSIGVGEDGPTHEPVEQLIGLRSIPNLNVFRPADAKETVAGWCLALKNEAPTALVLSRQNLPVYEGSSVSDAMKGGYVIEDCKGKPDVLLIATGSEVEPCIKAKALLEKEKIKARVISLPCFEAFERQSESYREKVMPSSVRARVCVEAASPFSWYRYAGEKGEIISMNSFGESGNAAALFEKFGFTAENIAERAKVSLSKCQERNI